jgi:transcriptional regulator with XRE-family HTH domain
MKREDFAALLKDFRRRAELTQEAAAEFFGVSLRTWQNWEIARNMPRGFGLRALVLALQNSSPRPTRTRPVKPRKKSSAPARHPQEKISTESAPAALEAHLL